MQSPKDILENQPWNLVEDEIVELELVDEPDEKEEEDDDEAPIIPEKKVTEKKTITEDDEEEKSIFSILAEDFTQKGIASFEDGWDGDEEEFRDKIYEHVKASVLEDLQITDPIVSSLLEYVSNGGDANSFISQVATSSVATASDEDVYIMYMKSTTNFSDEKINKMLARAKDLDEFEDEVETFREEIKAAQEIQVQELAKKQEVQKRLHEQQLREDAALRKKLVQSKELLGVPIVKNKEFEKFYLSPTETYTMDGKSYKITPYQKRLLDRQKNRAEYETFLAYLEFTDYNLPSDVKKAKAAATTDLKNRLQTYVTKGGKTTTLIDETQ